MLHADTLTAVTEHATIRTREQSNCLHDELKAIFLRRRETTVYYQSGPLEEKRYVMRFKSITSTIGIL